MDRIVTSNWAFTDNQKEKGKMNYEIYLDLMDKYKVWSGGIKKYIGKGNYESIDQDKYDVIYECTGTGYGHKNYKIYKNAPHLSTDELALICDGGNLCFGYRAENNNRIVVHTD